MMSASSTRAREGESPPHGGAAAWRAGGADASAAPRRAWAGARRTVTVREGLLLRSETVVRAEPMRSTMLRSSASAMRPKIIEESIVMSEEITADGREFQFCCGAADLRLPKLGFRY
jgi:hypothetical protein